MSDFATADYFSDQDIAQDPYDYLDYLREQNPVFREPNYGVVRGHGVRRGDRGIQGLRDVFGGQRHRWAVPAAAVRACRRRHLRADRGAPAPVSHQRNDGGDGSAGAHPRPFAPEPPAHSCALERERRLHVGVGRSPARRIHRQWEVRGAGRVRQALRHAGDRRPAGRTRRGPRGVPQESGRGQRTGKCGRRIGSFARRGQPAGMAGRQVHRLHRRTAPSSRARTC